MSRVHPLRTTRNILLSIAFLTGAQHLHAQSTAKPAPQGKTQKLVNPLNEYLDEAQKFIDKNEFASAIPPLQKFIAEKPDVAFAHFQLGYVYTALKQFDEARPEFERAIAIDPKMAEAQLNLGILLLERDPKSAVAPLTKAVELLPAQSRPRFLLGAALENNGDLTAAANSYEGAAHLDSSDPESLIHLGNIYLTLKRDPEAETKFRAALQIEPQSPPALLGLAKSLETQKKPEASEAYKNYLATQPNDPGAGARIVRTLVDQQKYDEAIAELDRADAGQPPTLDSLRMRADVYVAAKKWPDAAATIQKAVALTPKDAQLHGGLGRVYMQERDFANADKELKAAIALDHSNISYWKDLSSNFYLAGNFTATLATLDAIAKAEPPVPGTWFIRAICYDKLNQPKLALGAYQKFLDVDKGSNSDQVWQAQQRIKALKLVLEHKH